MLPGDPSSPTRPNPPTDPTPAHVQVGRVCSTQPRPLGGAAPSPHTRGQSECGAPPSSAVSFSSRPADWLSDWLAGRRRRNSPNYLIVCLLSWSTTEVRRWFISHYDDLSLSVFIISALPGRCCSTSCDQVMCFGLLDARSGARDTVTFDSIDVKQPCKLYANVWLQRQLDAQLLSVRARVYARPRALVRACTRLVLRTPRADGL